MIRYLQQKSVARALCQWEEKVGVTDNIFTRHYFWPQLPCGIGGEWLCVGRQRKLPLASTVARLVTQNRIHFFCYKI